ncbi:NAD+ kinase [Chitinophaga ginsengisegetis]|uniref:NAD kinase n=1 Tax=Chitinophaga ginsengisegetis TaxID=393003 RepID=A0A1T5P593_9BACT|nr:NAD kinase [Chitinophaga ginsengisegetis]MDR6566512.1 NAD+ kinase [Chitinophaga ginsengisegetis]MDR6646242.1 NAD+ kinase [Chitinophaga ginsengisegetis]MDR6651165.1 NAD+ kinase [Chitinophaga ginsengisegetis]SKD07954.1 NAD+ kinase [Chitinophaga ginsengisegetis]
MQVALYSRGFITEDISNIRLLLEELKRAEIEAIIYEPFFHTLEQHIPFDNAPTLFSSAEDLPGKIDFLVSLGGDGTLLDTVCYVRDTNIPVIGINFGRLGFLASIGKEEIHALVQALLNRTYVVDQRSLLHLDANIPLFGDVPYALNEFTIHKKDTSAMVKIHTYLNGEFLNTYWADGLIVATPTGSTGYSLSCGGPIVFPDAGNFVITPVAPHNLNVRPIIVPNNNIISFEVEGRSDQFLCTLDSRMETIDNRVQLAVKKEEFKLSLLRLDDSNFLHTLRNKLLWGIDARNTIKI